MIVPRKRARGKKRPPALLSHGRPPTFVRKACMSSKATRKVIRSHHQLQKQKSQALAKGDTAAVQAISAQLEKHGGLEVYQQASLQGQSRERGGDTSKVLEEWLKLVVTKMTKKKKIAPPRTKLRMLEVGALSTQNACSHLGLFDVTRIDLHAQEEGILQQDFMHRPVPRLDQDRFDLISLSLVLNYVSDPVARGDMLLRTTYFLRRGGGGGGGGGLGLPTSSPPAKAAAAAAAAAEEEEEAALVAEYFPALFIVLPKPCLSNSRYLTNEKFQQIMHTIGYTCLRQKQSSKLAYSLWRYHHPPPSLREDNHHHPMIPKTEIRPGKNRNNFAIVIGE